MANSDLEVNDAANNMENNTQKKLTISCVGTLFHDSINITYQNSNHNRKFLLNNSR